MTPRNFVVTVMILLAANLLNRDEVDARAQLEKEERLLEAVDELIEITGIDEERAKTLIMKAREHWFTA